MPLAASPAASAAPSGLEAKIKKLEQQLSIVTAERNDLAADVEALCMQSSGDIFSASSVLGDRICHIQKEANRLQSQVCPDQNVPATAAPGWTDARALSAAEWCPETLCTPLQSSRGVRQPERCTCLAAGCGDGRAQQPA